MLAVSGAAAVVIVIGLVRVLSGEQRVVWISTTTHFVTRGLRLRTYIYPQQRTLAPSGCHSK
jgi:hypothetical protein